MKQFDIVWRKLKYISSVSQPFLLKSMKFLLINVNEYVLLNRKLDVWPE